MLVKKTSNKIDGWYVWMSFTSAQHAYKQNKNLSYFPALGQIHNTSVNGPIDEQEASVVESVFLFRADIIQVFLQTLVINH